MNSSAAEGGRDETSDVSDEDALVAAVRRRTNNVVDALRSLDEAGLLAPSTLPGWSRLTIACHLRYGASTLAEMTRATLAGETASYYPGGRATQRPGTLEPGRGEDPSDVVASLASLSAALDQAWALLTPEQWATELVEPADNPDLGPLPLHRLMLSRLTEVEVHGSDLDLGLADWSAAFVTAALPFRVQRFTTRRTNHLPFDDVSGSWLLAADDGPRFLVSASGSSVAVSVNGPPPHGAAVIEGASRDLLALLLGRPTVRPLRYSGDETLGHAFRRAFPGP